MVEFALDEVTVKAQIGKNRLRTDFEEIVLPRDGITRSTSLLLI